MNHGSHLEHIKWDSKILWVFSCSYGGIKRGIFWAPHGQNRGPLARLFPLQIQGPFHLVPCQQARLIGAGFSLDPAISGWWFQFLWKIWKSIGMIILNIWEHKKCSKPPTRYYKYVYTCIYDEWYTSKLKRIWTCRGFPYFVRCPSLKRPPHLRPSVSTETKDVRTERRVNAGDHSSGGQVMTGSRHVEPVYDSIQLVNITEK